MAPPTKFARLNAIDPEALAREVTDAVRAHAHRLTFELGQTCVDAGPCNLTHSVRDLAEYAIRGRALDAPVQEYLLSVAPPVWTRAADGAAFHTAEFDDADPDALEPGAWLDELVMVMRAALAREKLDRGIETMTPAEIAILGSRSAVAVRSLCRDGEIRAHKDDDGWAVDPVDARAWLAGRSKSADHTLDRASES